MNLTLKQLILLVAVLVLNLEAANSILLKDQDIFSDGVQRTYDIYVPDKNLKQSNPLILLLHGHGGNADVMTGQNNKKGAL